MGHVIQASVHNTQCSVLSVSLLQQEMWSHLAGDGVSVALLKLYLLLARAPGVCISRSGKGPGGCVLQCQSGTKPDATEGEVVD